LLELSSGTHWTQPIRAAKGRRGDRKGSTAVIRERLFPATIANSAGEGLINR